MDKIKFRTSVFINIFIFVTLLVIATMFFWRGIKIKELLHFAWILSSNIALLGFLLAGAFGLGSIMVHIIGFRDRARPEFYLYSICLGMGVIAHLVFLIGALGLLYPSMAWSLMTICACLTSIEIVRSRKIYSQVVSQIRLPKYIHWFSALLIVLLLANWAYPLLFSALLPPITGDGVAYHLAIPKIYIQNHAITYIPFIPYSNWPLETEMLYTLSLLFSSESLAQLIGWTALLLVCAGLFIFGRRHFGTKVGLLAAVFFSGTPMVNAIAGTSLIELSLTLYTMLATLTFLEWLQSGNQRDWVLSALFGGLAASTKLNAALVPLILGTLMVIILLVNRVPFFRVVKQFFIYGLLSAAIVSPWYLKAWLQTGNPVWPFFFEIFGGRNWDALGSEYLFGFIRKPNMPMTPLNWLLGLWWLTKEPFRFGPYRLGWHYLVLLPISIPALIPHKPITHKVTRWLAIISLIFYTSWFLQTHQTRFLMPVLPALALMISAGVAWYWQQHWRRIHWQALIQLCLVLYLGATNWLASPVDRNLILSRWPYLSDQISRDQFLVSQIPGYETYIYANRNLPKNAYVWLALYEVRGYYLDREYMWANPISQRALPLEKYQDASQLASELRARGFTHVIFRSAFLERYTYIRYGEKFTQLTRQLLSEHADLIFRSSELELYALRPEVSGFTRHDLR